MGDQGGSTLILARMGCGAPLLCTLPAKAGTQALTPIPGFIILAAVTQAPISNSMHGLRETMPKARMKKRPWNQGKTVGQRRPFTPREIQIIRYTLEQERNARDLALFNTAKVSQTC
jgi:hypothetical protein